MTELNYLSESACETLEVAIQIHCPFCRYDFTGDEAPIGVLYVGLLPTLAEFVEMAEKRMNRDYPNANEEVNKIINDPSLFCSGQYENTDKE